jgi:mannose-1-phosphate guanylyltransferase/mannose-1-phosphate guanylyltransferase/mannose-6-phosphate isomerase
MRMSALPNRYYEDRPWGSFDRFTHNEISTVKIITVNAGEAFSLQRHHSRSEWWKILSGSGIVTIDGVENSAQPGDEYVIPQGSVHRASAGTEPLTFLEIAFGQFEESDIERLEDKYGRN